MAITPFKVTSFGTNRKPIFDFLLVIYSNLITSYVTPFPSYGRSLVEFSLSIEECLPLLTPLGVIPGEYVDKLYLFRN